MNADRDRDLNHVEIERQRHKCDRLRMWLWGFVLWIPVTLVIPTILAIFLLEGMTAQLLGLGAVLLPMVGLAGLLLMANDLSKAKHHLNIAVVGQEMGLRFFQKADPQSLDDLNQFSSFWFADATSGQFQLSGQLNGVLVEILEYILEDRARAAPVFHVQTVFLFQHGIEDIPSFVARPRYLVGSIREALGWETIQIADRVGATEFQRNFILLGDDPEYVVDIFTDEMIELCLEEPTLTVEVQGDLLLLHRRGQIVKPESYDAVVALGLQWVRALRAI